MKKTIFTTILLVCYLAAAAQRGQSMKNITPIDQEEMIGQIAVFLAEKHYDAPAAKAAGDSLRARFKRGTYQEVAENVAEFTKKIDFEIRGLLPDGLTGLEMTAGFSKYMGLNITTFWLYAVSNREARKYFVDAKKSVQDPVFTGSRRYRLTKYNGPSPDTVFTRYMFSFWRQIKREWNINVPKRRDWKKSNYNFGQGGARILPSGAGYWDIDAWDMPETDFYHDKFAAATALLEDAPALIVDLRGVAFGNPAALPHFFAVFEGFDQAAPLGCLKGKTGAQIFATPKKRKKGAPKIPRSTPIYVLTDARTAGLSEWAVWLLKENLGATIVGEKTAGQAFLPDLKEIWADFIVSAAGRKMETSPGLCPWEDKGIAPGIATTTPLEETEALCRRAAEDRMTALTGTTDHEKIRTDWLKALTAPQPDSASILKYTGAYKLGKKITWGNGMLRLEDGMGEPTGFRQLEPGVFMAGPIFGEDGKANVQRHIGEPVKMPGKVWDPAWLMPSATWLPIKPLYLSFPEGESPDMTVIYTNGRHYIFEREGKTENVDEKETEADENAYDPFADTVKNGAWIQSVLKEYPGEMEGTEAAPFEFTDMEGEYLSSGNFLENKAVVLNFWFSACGPCVAEMPAFNALKEKYADQDVSFIGINNNDDSERIIKFLKKHPFNFHLVANDEDQKTAVKKSVADYKAVVFPSTVLIGKDGKIKFARAGYLPEYSGMLDRAIKKELGL